MLSSIKFLLKSQFKHQSPQAGFTLIELLVAIILAALIITPVLGFMINFLQTDQREQAKTTSEQEIQSALDYIAQDLKQAIYIYDQDGLTGSDEDGIADDLDQSLKCPDGADCTPVIAFWKRRFLAQGDKINGTRTVGDVMEGNDTFVYSLVTYALVEGDDDDDDAWSDKARIMRYELRDGKCETYNRNGICTGYRLEPDPDDFRSFDLSESGNLEAIMNKWDAGRMDEQPGDVLIDYIEDSNSKAPEITCRNDDQRIPAPDADQPNIGLVACVDSSNLSTPSAKVYLRGNALARVPTLKEAVENEEDYERYSTFFPTSSTQVKGNSFLFTE